MSVNERLTIIILTYNRYPRLLRLLKYIDAQRCGCPIMLLDSSSDSFDMESAKELFERNKIKYIKFDSSLYPTEKISRGLNEVKTPYVVLWADDDFLVPTTLLKCATFLDTHPDYGLAQGRPCRFQVKKKKNANYISDVWYKNTCLVQAKTSADRMFDHLENYTLTAYAVHRREVLKKSVDQCVSRKMGYRFDELVMSTLSVIYGKAGLVDGVHMLKEMHTHTNSWEDKKQSQGPFDWVFSPDFSEQAKQAIQCLGEVLADEENMDLRRAEELATRAIWCYVGKSVTSRWRQFNHRFEEKEGKERQVVCVTKAKRLIKNILLQFRALQSDLSPVFKIIKDAESVADLHD